MVDDEKVPKLCKMLYKELKNERFRYIIFVVKDDELIEVETVAARDAGYEQFIEDLHGNNEDNYCRYGVFDFEGMGVVQDTQGSVPVLIAWVRNAKYKTMNYYTLLKEALKGLHNNIQVDIIEDLDFNRVRERLK